MVGTDPSLSSPLTVEPGGRWQDQEPAGRPMYGYSAVPFEDTIYDQFISYRSSKGSPPPWSLGLRFWLAGS
jgi:hypothetical protein